jgi:hypothetical protein
MIIASAAFYGILPRAFDFVGLTGVATFIYQLQATGEHPKHSVGACQQDGTAFVKPARHALVSAASSYLGTAHTNVW